jgi:Holliday junction resolvase RusA-like endonuclease
MISEIARFTVEGNPLPKQSFRYSSKRHHQPQRLLDWQNEVGRSGLMNRDIKQVLSNDFRVILSFYRGTRHKVDLDNLSKAILDALEGVFYVDDRQVVDLYLHKKFDKENPRVEVEIWAKHLEIELVQTD